MTLENEKTLRISNKQVLTDIELTKKESHAYALLLEGFGILATLPENKQSGKSQEYYFQSQKCESLMMECDKFLDNVVSLAKERGLIK